MKKLLSLLVFVSFVAPGIAQSSPAPAEKGTTYGETISADQAIPVSEVEANMKDARFTGKAVGKVVSVCQEKGCWMKMENSKGEPMMVKFKGYGFFMPRDIVGKEVVVDGDAAVKQTSVKQLRHYAGDAGKTKEEISKITTAKKELIFTAKGVRVL